MNRTLRTTVIATMTLLLLTPPLLAAVIVFDPTNFGVNLEQVAHHLEVISRLDRQIRNQARMLENWQFTHLGQLLASMERIRGTVEGVAAVDLLGLYPIDSGAYADRDANAMQELRRQRLESHRAAVLQARTAQNQVVGEMPGAQSRVRDYLEHSRVAPGQTAVLQASNETIATLAAQLQDLQALELAEARVELETEAQHQAEAAFHRQRCAWLMRDWSADDMSTSAPQRPIQSPFGNQ
ncbi:MAG: hypothetical protein PVJ57_03750 [Phycisphaerae bacterium]|jgi:conjugal transfer/entry exclusion protein